MIRYNNQSKIFHINTKNTSYIFKIDNIIKNLYWGTKIDDLHDIDQGDFLSELPHSKLPGMGLLPFSASRGEVSNPIQPNESYHSSFDFDTSAERDEYPCWNGRGYTEQCLNIGVNNTSLFLTVISHEIKENNLFIILSDDNSKVSLTLKYVVFYENDVIGRNATIKNNGQDIILTNIQSACVNIPQTGGDYNMRYVSGKWCDEWQINNCNIEKGVKTIQSKRGISGPHFNPSIAIGSGDATEINGKVWFGALAYSGNWKISVERTSFENIHFTAGINDFDFSYTLESEKSFETPILYIGFTDNGYGEMSRIMHKFIKNNILSNSNNRKVLYNSWEATTFDVKVEEQKILAEKASKIGVELFVVDDGWFGKRNSDKAGLGDWFVNKEKFPNGLEELISYVNGLGMDFGIWIELEAVNPDSDLYREHPQWIYSYEGVEPLEARNQLVLNITLPQVKEYLKAFLHKLLTEQNITYLKWDMNRPITDMSSIFAKNRQELWHNHVMALYEIWEYIRTQFPKVELETCAGGGGRVDLGIMAFAHQCWPSDNTDPLDRLNIQEGYTQFYPTNTMTSWVTDNHDSWGKAKRSIKFNFNMAMCGVLGIGANIRKLSQRELDEFKLYIDRYKEVRHVIQDGLLYRLNSPSKSDFSAVSYVYDNKEIVVICFITKSRFGDYIPTVKLQGLEKDGYYKMDCEEKIYSGTFLMEIGIKTKLHGDFDSILFCIKKVEVLSI